MATLTKADLAKHLDEQIGLTNREAKEIVEFFFNDICQALIQGKQVKLSGFGNFTLHDKKERPGRNPRTGEEVPVSARRVVTFHCGQKLKARVEKHVGKEMQGRNTVEEKS
jgi:integration host factor subunit alpha